MASQTVKLPGWGKPQISLISGGRLHLNHGPIDLVIRAEGSASDVSQAYAAAAARFENLLPELVSELPQLRQPLTKAKPAFRSPIAQAMTEACWPYRDVFITPMAAVAGAVADAIKAAMLAAAPQLETLYVNNGGDIALHIGEGQRLRIGLVADLAKAVPDGVVELDAQSGIGGMATSGWRGRSFSLGIADAVTVLAKDAATADAAATIIANAVNTDTTAVQRAPAVMLYPDSDLGNHLVTTDVGILSEDEMNAALAAGSAKADSLISKGQIDAALLAIGAKTAAQTRKKGALFHEL